MTWPQLEQQAAGDNLKLHRTHGGVTVFTTDSFQTPIITITSGDMVDEDVDIVMRRTLAAALRALRELPR